MTINLSAYRYLTFLLPGGLLLFVCVYGWQGWTHGEPGATSALGLATAMFMVGHALAGFANWLQPVWWGRLPGTRVPSNQGLFSKGSRYEGRQADIERQFGNIYTYVHGFEAQFGVAYVEAQVGPLGPKLLTFVEEIGFYRAMATASLLGSILLPVFSLMDRHHLPLVPWVPILLGAAALYALRLRRFWRYVGEYVVGSVLRGRSES